MTNQDLPRWVDVETSKQRSPSPRNMPARKPSALAPKPKAKPKEPETPRLHVRVTFQGSITFRLEGPQAEGVRELLKRGADAEEIIGTLDPWSSGAPLKQTIDILEDPFKPGASYYSCHVVEQTGRITSNTRTGGPWFYTTEGGSKPVAIDWDQVGPDGEAAWTVTVVPPFWHVITG